MATRTSTLEWPTRFIAPAHDRAPGRLPDVTRPRTILRSITGNGAHVPSAAEVEAEGLATAPDPIGRIASVDLLRGLVVVLMALDHVRNFFSPFPYGPKISAGHPRLSS